MKEKINGSLLKSESVKPGARPFEIFDSELRNLILRVEPSGTLTYYCAYRLRPSGRRGRYQIGKHPAVSPAGAREQAKIVLGDVARGVDPMAVVREQRRKQVEPTLGAFFQGTYADWVPTHYSNPKQIIKRLEGRFAGLLGVKLIDLSPFAFEKWKANRLATQTRRGRLPKAKTANRDMADLRAALSRAVTWGFLPENPLRRVKAAVSADDPIVRFLSDAEEHALRAALDSREELLRARRDSHNSWLKERHLQAVPSLRDVAYADHLKPMVLLSINTGLRRGELFKLEWTEVDLLGKSLKVTAAAAKSKKPRHIPLNSEALNILMQWKEQSPDQDTYVFTSPQGGRFDNVNKSWKGALKEAKISKFRWHDMRHHFASRLVMSGVDLNTVRELMGHADLKMTLRYAHLAPEHKALAIEKIVRAG